MRVLTPKSKIHCKLTDVMNIEDITKTLANQVGDIIRPGRKTLSIRKMLDRETLLSDVDSKEK